VRRVVLRSLALLVALAAGACAQLRDVADEPSPPVAALPNVTPTFYVPPLSGTMVDWGLSERVAAELYRYDVVASTGSVISASHVLYSVAEAVPGDDGDLAVTIYWDLVDPAGELVGTAAQRVAMSPSAWAGVPDDLDRLAKDAVARVVNILPGGQFAFADPETQVAVREEHEKLEERRRLYRKMATRGGLGPLSQRLFLRAEQAEAEAAAERQAVPEAVAEIAGPTEIDGPGENAARLAAGASAGRDALIGPASAAPVSTGGRVWVQLGVYPEETAARTYWHDLTVRHQDLFVGRVASFQDLDMGEKGRVVGVRTGPFESVGAGRDFCAALRDSAVPCFVTPTTMTADLLPPADEPTAGDDAGLAPSLGIMSVQAAE